MFFSCLILLVSLVNIFCGSPASGYENECADNPVFSPSSLVVKHGDRTSASCSVCQHDCSDGSCGLEYYRGNTTKNNSTYSWTLDNMTEWDIFIMCYNTDSVTLKQHISILPITVYKPPDNVSISVFNHTGPMLEGHQYTLQCTVQDVAPVGNLTVTFYRGQTPLLQMRSDKTTKTPVTEIYTLKIRPSKDDDGAQYRCEAKLELGPEGPQDLPVQTSQILTATVYYKPQAVNSSSHEINVTEGETLHLNFSAVGNPFPVYTWIDPLGHNMSSNNSVLTIKSVRSEHAGQYTCTVRNIIGEVNMRFNVRVNANYIPYIIAMVIGVCIVVGVSVVVGYIYYYRHSRMGEYNFKKVLHDHKKLIPMAPA